MKKQTNYSPWLHRIALLTAGATFPLVIMGGIVTSTESGLAVPDWPTSFGYNMFTYPLSEMLKDPKILYEHSHRLMGSLVGLLTIMLFVMLIVRDSRKWLKWLGVVAFIAVCLQGALGGLRVLLDGPEVTEFSHNLAIVHAIVHACLAQAFFALLCGICWFTSRDWIENQNLSERIGDDVSAKKLRRLSLITTCLIYIQLVFGAVLRHTGHRLDAHLLFAFLVALHIFLLVRRFFSMGEETQNIGQSLPLLLLGLLAVQLMLGTGAYITKLTALSETVSELLTNIVTTAHVAVGALMLVSSFVITLKIYRFTDTTISIETPVSNSLVTE
jgi:cytochrome c oxidase assembly protein subunit 15